MIDASGHQVSIICSSLHPNCCLVHEWSVREHMITLAALANVKALIAVMGLTRIRRHRLLCSLKSKAFQDSSSFVFGSFLLSIIRFRVLSSEIDSLVHLLYWYLYILLVHAANLDQSFIRTYVALFMPWLTLVYSLCWLFVREEWSLWSERF